MSWNVKDAVSYLRLHALASSSGNCAKFVRSAIKHGGVVLLATNYAKDYGSKLTMAGFSLTHSPIREPGDVVVIQPIAGNSAGHMAMFDGEIWISDYRQYHGFYPSQSYRHLKPPYKIYRHL